jgi:methionine-rich copper-binding protein CopC
MQLRARRAGLIAAAAALFIGAAALVVLVLGRPPGAALSSALPAAGSRLAEAPSAVSLTFTEPLARAHLAVSGTSGGPAVMTDRTVRMPVTMPAAGRYLVAYHVVTVGGSELVGNVAFTVATGRGEAADAALPEPPAPALPEVPGGHQHGELGTLTVVVITVNVAAGLAVASLMVLRRRRLPG